MREITPLHEEHWFEIYGRIALTGEPMRFEKPAEQLHRFYDVYAWRVGEPAERKVAILFNDITERKQAEAEREQLAREQVARAAAEAANRSKDEFLAMVSHELRSPLNAILGYTRMLRSGPIDRDAINNVTAIVERSAKAQLQIIEDLLDSARIITGKLRIEPGPVDLALSAGQVLRLRRLMCGSG